MRADQDVEQLDAGLAAQALAQGLLRLRDLRARDLAVRQRAGLLATSSTKPRAASVRNDSSAAGMKPIAAVSGP